MGWKRNDSLQAPEAQMTKMIAELVEQRFGLPSTAGHDTTAEGELAAILSHRTHRLPTCRFPKTFVGISALLFSQFL
jgi:hypothetical protein